MSKFTKLSRAEMKHVLGGDHPVCVDGQDYTCVSMGNCETVTGHVCSTSAQSANNAQIATWTSQGTWGEDCYTQVSCGITPPQ